MFKRAKYHLPKFEPPQVAGLCLRERLFTQLDGLADKRALWISSPAGSGKTSLVASYLAERNKNIIWYQVDAGDGDIASFFHHMALCIKNAYPKKRGMLPDFTSEYLAGLPAFSLNYFRELFKKMEPGSVLVLDNFQDAGEQVSLHEVMQYLLKEIPEGVQLVILSRVDPPAVLASSQTSQQFALLSMQDIHFDREESDKVADLRSEVTLSKTQYAQLHELTQGWAAGLILTLRHLKVDPDFLSHRKFDDRNALFNYVVQEIVTELDEPTRLVLFKTSFLKRISLSVAIKLTEEPRTKKILQHLSSHQLLTIQHNHIDGSFEYHPLFRAFLIQQAKQTFDSHEFMSLQNKAGELLLNQGDFQAAAQLFISIKNWDSLAVLIKKHADQLIQKGLFLTVEKWLESCPEEILLADAWLYYWQACCFLQYKPIIARPFLEKAHSLFKKDGDAKGLYLSWCNIIESYIQTWDTFMPIKSWVTHFYRINSETGIPGLELKARVAVNMTAAMTYTWMEHEDYSKWLKKAEYYYRIIPVKQISGLIGAVLGFVYYMKGDIKKLKKINASMLSILDSDTVTPIVKLGIYYNMVLQSVLLADVEILQQTIRSALSLSDSTGVRTFDRMFELHNVNACLMVNDHDSTMTELARIRHMGISPEDGFYGFFVYAEGRAELERGNYIEALAYFTEAEQFSQDCGFPYSGIEYMLGITQILMGHRDDGVRIINDINHRLGEVKLGLFEFSGYSFLAYACLLSGDSNAMKAHLEAAFKTMQSINGYSSLIWSHHVFNTLAVKALELDIDTVHLHEFIRRNCLTPPEGNHYLDNWPWPLKIYTLGRFSVLLNDRPLDTDSRPFDLLKVLLAFGGRDVHEEKIMDALWPDAEGDQSQASFKTTLHRLRKVWGDLDILVLKNHQLSLNQQFVWVDTWAMSRLYEPAQQSIKTKNTAQSAELVSKLMQLYRGHFLANEPAGWVIHQREGLRLRFIRHCAALAQAIESEDSQTAIQSYQRLLEIDPLIEEAYQGLIRCYQRQGQQAEAQASYKKCVTIFASTSGCSPSTATTDLIKS